MSGWVDVVTGFVMVAGGIMIAAGVSELVRDVLGWIAKQRYAGKILFGGVVLLFGGVARAAWSRDLIDGWIVMLSVGIAGAILTAWMFRGFLRGLLAIVAPYGWFKGEQ